MRRRLVVGKWKMNGSLVANQALLKSLIELLKPISSVDFSVCVPYPYLSQVADLLRATSIAWGAQDVCEFGNGAYTGEVSASMVAEFGCQYVIVGHSERRSLFADSEARVALKFSQAQAAGLTPILCVGETLEQRESGQMEAVVASQLDAVIHHAGVASLAKAVVAYEPVWAIGTGKTASPDQAQAVHAFIRSHIGALNAVVAQNLSLLYGGSVKGSNAAELFAQPDIDGGLIGGAALVADDFAAIGKAFG